MPYGVRKRIEVVRALMSRPRVLMLDEPAAGLNPRETAELSAFLKSVAWDGLTLLVVEHDMSFVHDLCDRTVVLNFGRLIYDGPTRDVQDEPGRCVRPISAATVSPTPRRPVLLEVSNLDVRYGRNHAVKGLNLTVGRGRTDHGARSQRRRQEFTPPRHPGPGPNHRRLHPL